MNECSSFMYVCMREIITIKTRKSSWMIKTKLLLYPIIFTTCNTVEFKEEDDWKQRYCEASDVTWHHHSLFSVFSCQISYISINYNPSFSSRYIQYTFEG